MDLLSKVLLFGLLVAVFAGLFTSLAQKRRTRRARHAESETGRRAIAKSIARHYRRTGELPRSPRQRDRTSDSGDGRVLREVNDGVRCFSTIELRSGDQVMISIAAGGIKIFRMTGRGGVPIETLWSSNDPSEIAQLFFAEERPEEHPLEAARNFVLNLDSANDIRELSARSRVHPALEKLTSEQRERLARITDEKQRKILLDCIERGEVIPDFAWRPLPVKDLLASIPTDPAIVKSISALRALAAERGLTLQELLESERLQNALESEPAETQHEPTSYDAPANFDAILNIDEFVGSTCTVCGMHAALFTIPGQFVGACPKCIADRIEHARTTSRRLPDWLLRLEQEARKEERHQHKKAEQEFALRFDDFYKCANCGKLIHERDARYYIDNMTHSSPPYCQECFDGMSRHTPPNSGP